MDKNPCDSSKELTDIKTCEVWNVVVMDTVEKTLNIFLYTEWSDCQFLTSSLLRKGRHGWNNTSKKSICLGNEKFAAHSELLFQRFVVIANQSPTEWKIKLHLSWVPLQHPCLVEMLFYALWKVIECNDLNSTDNTWYHLDGGSLKEIISWTKGQTFEKIFQCYINHVLNVYKGSCF